MQDKTWQKKKTKKTAIKGAEKKNVFIKKNVRLRKRIGTQCE